MRNLLYIAGLMLVLASCEKEPIEQPKLPTNGTTTTTPTINTSSPTIDVPSTATVTGTMQMPKDHGPAVEEEMQQTETVTETFSTDIPEDAITDDPRLTFVSTDGKGGNAYILNNRPSDNAPAFIVTVDGEFQRAYGSADGLVTIQAGFDYSITYAREYTVGQARVLVEETINQTTEELFIRAIMDAQALVPARNNYSDLIALVNTNVHQYDAGGTAGERYYDVASSAAGSLYVHIHEMGHNFDASAGIVDHGVLQMLYDMPDMFFVSDYGNNNGTGEYWAEAYAFYYLQIDHINHILEYIMNWLD